MKKLISVLLSFALLFSLCACGAEQNSKNEVVPINKAQTNEVESEIHASAENDSIQSEISINEEDMIDDVAWDELESLGKIEKENGLFYVSITIPAGFAGDSTQESIDANAGETYTSGKLNEDGSVTYKMTKKQHKAMMDTLTESFEDGLQELVDSPDYTFTQITHNAERPRKSLCNRQRMTV